MAVSEENEVNQCESRCATHKKRRFHWKDGRVNRPGTGDTALRAITPSSSPTTEHHCTRTKSLCEHQSVVHPRFTDFGRSACRSTSRMRKMNDLLGTFSIIANSPVMSCVLRAGTRTAFPRPIVVEKKGGRVFVFTSAVYYYNTLAVYMDMLLEASTFRGTGSLWK